MIEHNDRRNSRRRTFQSRSWLLLAAGLLLGAGLPGAWAQQADSDGSADAADSAASEILVLGPQSHIFDEIHITADQRVEGELVCIGCTLTLDGPVSGDLVIIGGNAEIRASVDGDLVAVGSTVVVEAGVDIGGDMVTVFSGTDAPDVQVGGSRVKVPAPFPVAGLRGPFSALTSILGWLTLIHVLVIFVVLLLIAAIASERVKTIGDALGPNLGLALLIGFLAHAAVLVIYALLAMSMVGLPLIPLVFFLFVFVRMFGRAGVLYLIGRQIGLGFGWKMSVLGGLALGFVPYLLLSTLPFFFGLVGLIVGLFFALILKILIDWPALGVVLLTSFGSPSRGPAEPDCSPPPPVVE